MNVLSLFDGISCGQVALRRANIRFDNYFSSEVDEDAINITQHNHPKTIQLGNILSLNLQKIPRIGLVIGGSPCQGFSFCGKRLNFEDERSRLFFEFVRILTETKPKYFLFENVCMSKSIRNIISSYLKVNPIRIDSCLVSAQKRGRLYWTNIPNVSRLDDKSIFLENIIDTQISSTVKLDLETQKRLRFNLENSAYRVDGIREVRTEEAKRIRRINRKNLGIDSNPRRAKLSEIRGDGKTGCILTSLTKDNLIAYLSNNEMVIRYPTANEAEKLQTLNANYTKVGQISDSQRYKHIGNGWTVDVIAHILSHIQ